MSEPADANQWYWEKRWASFRRGTASIRLAWDGGEARAVVFDVGVPITAKAILAALPLAVPVVHAAWSGDMLMSTRAYDDIQARTLENEVRLVRPGDLTWDPKFGELAFTYGTAECRLPTGPNTLVVYGSITSGLDAFADFSRRRRFQGIGELRIARA